MEVRILQGLAKRSFGMQGKNAEIMTDSSLSDDLRTGAGSRAFRNPLKRLDPRNVLTGALRYFDPDNALRRYAEFTTACMEFIGSGEELGSEDEQGSGMGALEQLSGRLYQDAYRLGSIIRRVTGFRERGDLDRLIFYLYRNIDIDMSGSTDSELLVSDCYFSNYYTPEQCRMMSNVDSGIIAGICGGGRLEFTERITEGCGRCRACFADNKE